VQNGIDGALRCAEVGSFKRSGHGREKGFEALYGMSATKTIAFKHG